MKSLSVAGNQEYGKCNRALRSKTAAKGPMSMSRHSMTEMRSQALPMGELLPQSSCKVRRDGSSMDSKIMQMECEIAGRMQKLT